MSAIAGTTKVNTPRVMRPTSEGKRPDGTGRVHRRAAALGLQLLGALLVIVSVIVGVFVSHAGASPLSNSIVAIKDASGSSVATNPLLHHQNVTVSVSPNSTFDTKSLEAAGFPSGAVIIKIQECADPGGSAANLPTLPTQCDPTTLVANASAQADGSLSFPGYTIYALPDVAEIGPSNGTVCDMQNWCVIGLFSNQHDFTKPHLFSAPFQIDKTSGAAPTSTPNASANGSTSNGASGSASSTSGAGASAGVSVSPTTLANTGGPTLWPWLLGAGAILLVAGTVLRFLRRPEPVGGR
jgi:hypothetical protein